jgi:GNAT superfamily N-acetyltransferase
VTDYATYLWVCDVLIAEKYRHKGLAMFLMNVVLGHPDVKPRSVMLTTKDAHALYEKFGFVRFEAMKRQGGQA